VNPPQGWGESIRNIQMIPIRDQAAEVVLISDDA
jgi:hypothetical protein